MGGGRNYAVDIQPEANRGVSSFFFGGEVQKIEIQNSISPALFQISFIVYLPTIYIFQSLSAASKNLTQSIVLVSGYHLISHTGG